MDERWQKSLPVSWKNVRFTGGFWKKRQEINEQVTLPAEYEQCRSSGRVDSVKCIYKPRENSGPEKGVFTIDGVLEENMADGETIPRPHHYWDSDLAKWIEGASYALWYERNPETEAVIDGIIDDFGKLQMPDGYVNTYYTVVEPGKRWTNVHRMHELYCAGHLIEAAAAYYEATGKAKLLDIVERYADHIDRVFGPADHQIHGYPGHQEIELALVKLYRLTGKKKYLELAAYFLNERGKQPYFFEEEARQQGRDPEDGGPKGILGKSFLAQGPYALFQAHLPVREQMTAEGHAVRLAYMGAGMADVASETGDKSLWQACDRLWDNVTSKRMYITGGIGSQDGCERFNFDYQLPNEESYHETCASVAMVMWGFRMLQVAPDRRYGDVMERALYNGVLSGVSLSGDRFFYANHLAAHPEMFRDRIIRNPRMFPERQRWFAVSCCPMNLARLLESLGGYQYTQGKLEDGGQAVYVHLYQEGTADIRVRDKKVVIRQETDYPWQGDILVTVGTDLDGAWTLALRIPEWSGQPVLETEDAEVWEDRGYLYVRKDWSKNGHLHLSLPMQPVLMEAHPGVRMDCGKAAIQYGPLVYCVEEADNDADLFDCILTGDSRLEAGFEESLLGGICTIQAQGIRRNREQWKGRLYQPASGSYFEPVKLKAVPYYTWANRGTGAMTVWMNHIPDMDHGKVDGKYEDKADRGNVN